MSIEYHDMTVGSIYGEDLTLKNNWDPDKDYQNEYAKVYFRVNTKGYEYPSYCFDVRDREVFNEELIDIFTSLGWTCHAPKISGSCQIWTHGKSNLYLHPQNFSGEVLKNDIKKVAEAISTAKSFKLRWVDLYETYYEFTDAEYEEILDSKDSESKKIILDMCKTTRTNKFFYVDQAVRRIADKIRVPRIGIDDGRHGKNGQTAEHVEKLIVSLADQGYLVTAENQHGKLVRTINKTEQKQKKLFIA